MFASSLLFISSEFSLQYVGWRKGWREGRERKVGERERKGRGAGTEGRKMEVH